MSSSAREEILAGSTWQVAYEPQRAVGTERCKYIRRWGGRRTPVLLAGHVEPPSGVEINLPDQRSASEPTTGIP